MGSLALWRGVEGAGKGMSQLAEQRMADESYEKRAGIDEARESRMEALRQTNRIEIQTQSDDAAMSRLETSGEQAVEQIGERGEEARTTQAAGHEQNLEVEGERAFNQEQRQVIEQNWKSIENELDRMNRLDVASSGSASSSNPMVNAFLGRFEKTTLTEQEMNDYGIPLSQRDLPLTYDNMSGRFYAQEGDKFFLANQERPDLSKYKEQPTQEHFDALAANPDKTEDRFLTSFGYLPGWFLSAKMNAGLQNVAGPASE